MSSSSLADDSVPLLETLLKDKIAEGETLLSSLARPELTSVVGLQKLEKKIRQEVKFLRKFEKKRHQLKREHLLCSNLQHLSAVASVLSSSEAPEAVLQSFTFADGDSKTRKITVDIVGKDGLVWTKVVARNPRALDQNSRGRGSQQFGQRCILDHVKDFHACAKQNTRLFQAPEVVFVFHNGVSDSLARKLEAKGLVVKGNVIPSTQYELDQESSSDEEEDSECESEKDHTVASEVELEPLDPTRLNLDITAMIAYVSALTNGHADHTFPGQPVLAEQAAWERHRPVKPVLDALFTGKRLLCCQSAMSDFQTILKTLGGEGERKRAHQLLERIEVVEDMTSPRLALLDVSGKIKERSRAIFGTGDSLGVVTVTANLGFVRAARGQGVDLTVVLHESRALTEDKMKKEQQSED